MDDPAGGHLSADRCHQSRAGRAEDGDTYKTEKTKEGEGVRGVGLDAVQGKGERGHVGCSPAIEGPCSGRAWWRWSASTIEETGDHIWGRGRAVPTGVREEAGVEEAGGGWLMWRRPAVAARAASQCGGGGWSRTGGGGQVTSEVKVDVKR
jgi:hypothetical protein